VRVQTRHSIAAMVRAHESFYIEALHELDLNFEYLPRALNAHESR